MLMLCVGVVAGLSSLRVVGVISFLGFLQILIVAASIYALFALVADRYVGRLLSAGIFTLAACVVALACLRGISNGVLPIALSGQVAVVALHLILVRQLLFGDAVRRYCQGALDQART
jgi:hypothetical protein